MSIRFPHVLLLALGILLAAAAPLWASGDERPVDLPLVNGKTLNGVVKSATREEVVLETGPDKIRRIPVSSLTPLGVYRVRAALAPPADGEARKRLAELAADLGLFVEARVEYEKALALGALDERTFNKAVRGAEIHAVKQGASFARKQAESGDLEGALDTATKLRLHFSAAPNAPEINKLVNDLLKLVRELDEEAAEMKAELDEAMSDIKKNKEILRRKAEGQNQLAQGLEAAQDAAEARERGAVSKARKATEKADEYLRDARRNFGRLVRILPRGDELLVDVKKKLVELDRAQFELLFEMAWFEWAESKTYTRAEEYAARASYIDPVHPELMELRDELVSSRIRYRLSDVTNARGIVR